MKINVADILNQELGYNRQYNIEGEAFELESAKLTSPANGEITIFRSETGLLVSGRISIGVELDCHRCLKTFERQLSLSFSQPFSKKPGDDDMPIINNEIDLAQLIEQEVIVSLPIKLLCKADCEGEPGVKKEYI